MSIYYISPTGSDSNDGTSVNPYATVEKCITVCTNGDTIKVLNGTYSISSIINVNKQITITSNSGITSDVIFDSSTTIFNIQESNVIINYITLQTSSSNDLITIDDMSSGTTEPTFFYWNSNKQL